MAAKRTATTEVNHTNWNLEDDPEDAGTFSKAPEEVIKNRVIKVAKRRNPIGTLAASEGEKKSAFMNFGGFSKISSTSASSSSSPFGFLSNITSKSEEQPKTNGLNSTSIIKISSAETSNAIFHMPENKTMPLPFIAGQTHDSKKSKEYYAKLKGLNQSVSNWIKKHVDANPFLNLTPVFRDYEKYLDEIESSHKEEEILPSKDSELKTVTSTTKMETQKVVNIFTAKPSQQNTSENKTSSFTSVFTNTTTTKLVEGEHPEQQKEKYSFGTCSSENATLNVPAFSFGKASTQPTSSTAGFSFGSETPKPFAFSNVSKPAADVEGSKGGNEDDDEEPPKVEFTPVVEEGHTYTTRCKIFVKKDGKYGDRGVGNLYLKPVPDSDKIQLIVRADTSLGNLICNFILSTSIPMQRMGKKDVMLVCIPTPDSKPPPVPVLFRVKSPEAADELLRTLEKHKK